jgi:hypothetical protein
MYKAVLWHRFQPRKAVAEWLHAPLSVAATCTVIWVGSGFGVPFLATAVSFTRILHAEPIEGSAAEVAVTPQTCEEKFLLGRRDNLELALQRLRQCNSIYNAGANLEQFTFWYITLPLKSRPQQNSWFGNVWRNNLKILMAPPISVAKEDAMSVLDHGIVQGLKKGKREDLSLPWLATHDPAIIAAGVQGQIQSARVEHPTTSMLQPSQPRLVASGKIATPPPQGELVADVPKYHSAGRPQRYTQRIQSPGPSRRYRAPNHDPLTDELNRAQAGDSSYISGESFYRAPVYDASRVQPQPYLARSTDQEPSNLEKRPPSSYASIYQQQPYYLPAAPQQPSYANPQQTAYYLPLPLQIEANVRMILQQVTANIQTFEQAISSHLRGY